MYGGRVFVDRTYELAALEEMLAEALDGRAVACLLSGEPGVGKTWLAEELASRATAQGAEVLWGHCQEGGPAPAYRPWIQVLRTHLRRNPATPVQLGAGGLAVLLPELADQSRADPSRSSSSEARVQLFDDVAMLLEDAASERPVVVFLDDLHWADQATMHLLESVTAQLRDVPVLIVACYREEEAGHRPEIQTALHAVARHARRVALRGLGPDDVKALVHQTFGVPLPPALLASIHNATDGNPFFVHELVRLVLSDPGADELIFRGRIPLTEGIREIVRRRLGPVPDQVRGILQAAAVIGREFRLEVLVEATGLPRQAVRDALAEVERQGILREAGVVPGMFVFSHALVREALYEEIPGTDRAAIHLDTGHALERFYGDRVAEHLGELARHFVEGVTAGSPQQARLYATRAGQHAMARGTYEEAAAHLRSALALLDLERLPDEHARCDLLITLGDAERYDDAHTAVETFRAAAQGAQRVGSADLLVRAAVGFEDARMAVGDFWQIPVSVGFLHSALAAIGDGETAARSWVLSRLARALHFVSPPEQTIPIATEAVQIAERLHDAAGRAAALEGMRWAMWSADYTEPRLSVDSELIRVAEDLGDRERALLGRLMLIVDLLELGRIDDVSREIGDYELQAGPVRRAWFSWWAAGLQATRALMDGRFADAQHAIGTVREIATERGDRMAQGVGAWLETVLAWELGDARDVETSLAWLASQIPVPAVQASTAAFAHAVAGRGGEARAALSPLVDEGFANVPRGSIWLPLLCACCWVVAETDDAAAAQRLYELIEPYDGRVALIVPMPALLTTSHWLGVAAATAGRLDEAESHLVQAIALHERLGARPWVAHSRLALGSALLRRARPGDVTTARKLLAAARAEAEALGMNGMLAHVSGLLEGLEASGSAHPERIFRPEGEYWTLSYGGVTVRVRTTLGLVYLRALLGVPGQELHALQLAVVGGVADTTIRDPALSVGLSDLGPLLDEEAKGSYRTRLEELDDQIAEAEAFADPARAGRARQERELVVAELGRAVGLGGRDRMQGSAAERARLNVTRAIRTAVDRIAAEHPLLGTHLRTSIRTGTFCSYVTDPVDPAVWSTAPLPLITRTRPSEEEVAARRR